MEGAAPPRSHGNSAFAVSLAMLLSVLGLLVVTLLPSWRGGFFVRFVLFGALGLLVVDLFRLRRAQQHPEAAAPQVQDAADELFAGDSPPWEQIGLYAVISLAFFGMILVLGMYAGLALFLTVLLRTISRSGWRFALVYAVAAGLLLPWAFGSVLSLRLWPGVIPEVIPHWLGGGLLPPV